MRNNKSKLTCYPKLFFVLVLTQLFFVKSSIAQTSDSLRNELRSNRLADTMRVNILGRLAILYENVNTDSMIAIANEGLALADKINFETGRAICQQMLGLAYLHRSEHEKALHYYRNALATFEKTGNKVREGNTLLSIGDIFYQEVQYEQAIEYYNKGIEVYKQMNNSLGQGFALISIGGIYNDQSNYVDAINFYLKALSAFEKDKYNPGISMTLTNIASVYSSLGDNKKALDYINKSQSIDDSKSSLEQQALNISNTGGVYALIKDYQKALLFYNKGRVIAESMGDDTWKNNMLVDIADMHYYMQQYDSALNEYKTVLATATKISDTNSLMLSNRGLGRIMLRDGDIQGGIKKLLLAFELAQKKQIKQIIFETALDLGSAYEKERNYAPALQYHKIYADTKDSLFNEKNEKRIEQLQFDHELGEKENQIELLKKDKVIAQSRNDQQKVTTIALVIGLALLIVITIILYRSRSFEKRSKDEIVKQKEEIQLQATELEELNRFKDKTFSVLSHDLRSPLGQLTSTMMMLDSNIITQEEFALLKPELNQQLSSLNILLDNLLTWAKSYMQGKVTAKPEMVDINDIAVQNINLLKDIASGKQITLIGEADNPVNAFCDPAQMDIVIRNLISNAIKFTRTGGTVRISADDEEENVVRISIADNGIGMTHEQINKAFTTATDNSTHGTEGERGVGLGLLLCHEFVQDNNGTITVTSEVGKGTTFIVELPKTPNP